MLKYLYCSFQNRQKEPQVSQLPDPREDAAREALKVLKDGFDDPSLDSEEALIELDVRRSLTKSIRNNAGEIIHQLALRKERREEIAKADELYRYGFGLLEGKALAQARLQRDWGTMTLKYLDQGRGYEMVLDALKLHSLDVTHITKKGREKGRRQQLITQTYVWRSQVIIGDESSTAMDHLVSLVKRHEFDAFCVRDQKVIIDFLVPRTTESIRLEMLARQAEILAKRRKLLGLARTCTLFVIDAELSIVKSIWHKLLRKE